MFRAPRRRQKQEKSQCENTKKLVLPPNRPGPYFSVRSKILLEATQLLHYPSHIDSGRCFISSHCSLMNWHSHGNDGYGIARLNLWGPNFLLYYARHSCANLQDGLSADFENKRHINIIAKGTFFQQIKAAVVIFSSAMLSNAPIIVQVSRELKKMFFST